MILLLLLAAAVVPVILGWFLSIRCAGWTRRRIVLSAAAPVPGCLVALVVGLAATGVWTDQGGLILAIVSTVPGLTFATLLFGLGLALAALGVRLAGRRSASAQPIDEIFE